MDEIKPNATFIFTVASSDSFKDTDHLKAFNTTHYNIPDYWFKTEEDLLLFSTSLKESINFINYFNKCITYAIENNLESFITCTLRTNSNIIFLQVTNDSYIESIDKTIELYINFEMYEQCTQLVSLKDKFFNTWKNSGKSQAYSAYEFWKPLYPHFLY
jgi:hypothetical protein